MSTRSTTSTLAGSRGCCHQSAALNRISLRGLPARAPSASFNGVPLTTTASASPAASISEQLQQQLPSINVPTDLNVDLDTAKEVSFDCRGPSPDCRAMTAAAAAFFL
jgi:hypothetical protein